MCFVLPKCECECTPACIGPTQPVVMQWVSSSCHHVLVRCGTQPEMACGRCTVHAHTHFDGVRPLHCTWWPCTLWCMYAATAPPVHLLRIKHASRSHIEACTQLASILSCDVHSPHTTRVRACSSRQQLPSCLPSSVLHRGHHCCPVDTPSTSTCTTTASSSRGLAYQRR
jgi:hypothetical protein